MMKKLAMGLALITPLTAVAPALALNTGRTISVEIEGNKAGVWHMRNRVVDTGTACRITLQWSSLTGGPPLGRTTLCKIDELKASDNFDCEAARRGSFDTLIQKAPGTCMGFDEFGQQTKIDDMIAGEDAGGSIDGVIVLHSVGDVQSLHAQ